MIDLKNTTTQTLALAPIVKNSDTNCTGINTAGFTDLMFQVLVGASADSLSSTNKIELELEESDDDSTYTDCANTAVHGAVTGTNTGTFAVIDGTSDDDTLYTCRYLGTKKYARVVLNFSGTHTTGTPIGVVAVQSGERYIP